MARFSETRNQPEVLDRIKAAFWALLEHNRLDEITVSMVVGKALCNRGSFYYHFQDKTDLVDKIVDEELFGDDRFARAVVAIHTATDESATRNLLASIWSPRILLFMRQGGSTVVKDRMREFVMRRWRAILHPDGSELSVPTKFIIAYTTEAMLEMLVLMNDADDEQVPLTFLQEVLAFSLNHLSDSENLDEDAIIERLRLFGSLDALRS